MSIFDMLLSNAMGEGGGGGGGGSSDFSTAQVTLTIEEGYGIYLPFVSDNDTFSLPSAWHSGTREVILYKGQALGFPSDETAEVTVTGDIEYDYDEGEFLITGNGTITIETGR